MRTHTKIASYLMTILVILSLALQSVQPALAGSSDPLQDDGTRISYNRETNMVSFIGADPEKPILIREALNENLSPVDRGLAFIAPYAEQFGLMSAAQELSLKSSEQDAGHEYYRYQQTYQGVPVMAGEMIVNANDKGELMSLSGEVSPALKINTEPQIFADEAQSTALNAIVKWYQATPGEFTTSTPELWIYDARLLGAAPHPVSLVWRMEVTARDGSRPINELILVDAKSGGIILHFNQVDTAWTATEPSPTISADNPPQPIQEIPNSVEPVITPPVIQRAGQAATWYVSPGGNDTNVCSSPSIPCATIQQAVNLAINGDNIRIAEGTYTRSGPQVILINKNVNFYGGWNPTFDSQVGFSVIDGNKLRPGIIVDNGNESVITTIERFIITNASVAGIRASYGYTSTRNQLTLLNSAVINSDFGIHSRGILKLSNVTVSNNRNGGIVNEAFRFEDIVDIDNSTIANNTRAGVITAYKVNLQNTILSGNTIDGNPANCSIESSGVITSKGYNIIDNLTGCNIAAVTGDQFNVDPKISILLAPLGYHALLSGSPAIDAGNNETCVGTTDQRGMPRYDGNSDSTITCDIGSFEYVTPGSASRIIVMSGSDQHGVPGVAFSFPFAALVVDDQGNPVSGIDVTFTAPSAGPSGVFADSNSNTSLPIATGVDGIATSPQFTANDLPGSYSVLASFAGGNTAFELENVLWYVAPNGNDSNDCKSIANPCATINGALQKSYNGNKIFVAQGVYFEDLLYLEKDITLTGGWDAATFSTQNGISTVDAQKQHQVIFIVVGITVELEGFILTNGHTQWYGGGIANGGVLTVKNSIIKNNFAEAWGGGIYSAGTLILENTSIIKNSTSGYGGGIYNEGNLTAQNLTVGENFAHFKGGGVMTKGGSSQQTPFTSFNFATITDNQASEGGGIEQAEGATTQLQNTILAGNLATEAGMDCSGIITSNGHNIIGSTAGCTIGLTNNDKNTDPRLGILIEEKGYYPIASSSPAVDAGDNSCAGTLDQRGLPRPQGNKCDSGSFEYTSSTGAITSILGVSGDGQYTLPNAEFTKPLQVIVIDDLGSPVSGAAVNFAAPTSGPSAIFDDTKTFYTTAATDQLGVATTPLFSANEEFGEYVLIASVTSTPATFNFKLTNGGWFVSPAGNDSNNCHTTTTSCATINATLNKASAGDIIIVAQGVYTGGSTEVVSIQKNIILSGGWNDTFTAQDGFSTIDGENLRTGILVGADSTTTLEKFVIQNSSNSGVINDGILTINNSTISNNTSTLGGGGILNRGTLVLNDSLVIHNFSAQEAGGGIRNGGILTLNNTTIAFTSTGSGLWNGGTVTINHSQLHDNRGTIGGAINNDSGTIVINNSALYRNYATVDGGAIQNGGTVNINNSTIAANSATKGGGIYAIGTTTINNSTISGNMAFYRGGGLYLNEFPNGILSIKNTIVANNTAYDAGGDCHGQVTSYGYNIAGTTAGCTIARKTGDKFNVNPYLGPFLEAAGYYTLYPNSPAIDAGNTASCLPTDQRGLSRKDGDANGSVVCDVGAYEYTTAGPATRLIAASGINQHAEPGTPFDLPLLAVALDDQGTPVKGVGVTFSAPSSGASASFANNSNTITKATDQVGVANSGTLVANQEYGSYQVVATAPSLSQSVVFELTNIVWFVSITGNDSNNCTKPLMPCRNIQGVLNKVDYYSGELIRVAVGTYDSANMTLSKDVTIAGGWNNGFTQQIGASIIMDGITISEGATAHLERLTIQNTGVYGIQSFGDLTLTNSTIRLNEVGVMNYGRALIVNSTINQNVGTSSEFGGGGVRNWDNTVLIINSTITDNVGGGGIVQITETTGTITISNSVISGNKESTGIPYFSDCAGTITSNGYNLIGNIGSLSTPVCTILYNSTDQIGYYEFDIQGRLTKDATLYPRLAFIQNIGNGVWAQPVTLNSPALNAGNPITPGTADDHACSALDQRGVTRPQGSRCDIGAYELSFFQSTPVRISTYDAAHAWTLPGTLICQSNDAGCSTSVPGAWTAHKFAFGTYNFYLTQHGRNSLDNHGMEVISTVRYGTAYDNAFWNRQQMVYGDAHAFSNADDVVAHELTHGVTDFTSGLFYYYQSGAINESFSDLWGEAYDQIGNVTASDTAAVKWLIGEDVTGLGASRNMSNPPQFNDPDKMTSLLYDTDPVDNGGVHTNSGVNNKAVALMVDGGTFNGITVTALGWSKVLTVYYEAQTHLLTSGSDYLDLYNALYQACLNKVGTAGIVAANCQEVLDAVKAVEMNREPVAGFNPSVADCPSNKPYVATVFLEDFESGIDGWTFPISTGVNSWQLAGGDATSGRHMLWADDAYPMSISSAQVSFWVPNGTNSYLKFSHSYGFEFAYGAGQYRYYDGGIFEYSINGGLTWLDASTLFESGDAYPGSIFDPGSQPWANPFRGRKAFVGESHGYVDSRYNLSSLAGKQVTLRWRIGTDDGNYLAGWKLDDVQLSACGSNPDTFFDVSKYHWAWKYIESIYNAGITGGCTTSPLNYCPTSAVTRAQMAIFLERGMQSSSFVPPDATGTVFNDIPSDHWAAKWIEQLAADGVTGGCSNGNYCPNNPVTRDQMAVFLLRAKHGPTYTPPPVGTSTGFKDVPVNHWAAPWIKQLAAEGITGGCGDGNFCPRQVVTRAQMAVFLQITFGLPLP